jgi:sporulation protein YlmC with PRC-barrel domain
MTAYDSEAMLVGTVQEVGLRKSSNGDTEISVRISKKENNNNKSGDTRLTEVLWTNISKIGDIVLLGERMRSKASTRCASCGYQNEDGALFCEECGKKLS